MSKLPKETWMAYAECFVLMLPLRECARRCRICLKTAYTTRHRLIEGLSAYPPLVQGRAGPRLRTRRDLFPRAVQGQPHEGDIHDTAPRHRGEQVHRRRLSREQICVMTVVNDSNETFFEVSGRDVLSRKHAVDVLRATSRPVPSSRLTRPQPMSTPSLNSRSRCMRHAIPRTVPRGPSTGSIPSIRSSAPSWSRCEVSR